MKIQFVSGGMRAIEALRRELGELRDQVKLLGEENVQLRAENAALGEENAGCA